LRALLRRSNGLRPAVIRVSDVALDTGNHAVTRAGRPVSLTAKEYALLEFLMVRENRVVGREQIAQHVWDESFDPLSNVIDVYIKRLRGKLESGGLKRLIHTRRGEGYMLTSEAETGDD
jgi:two-component system copper resistance phosphate regulon response regulator CusR